MASPQMTRVLVTGASGNLGRRILRRLNEAAIPHRALVRELEKGAGLIAPQTNLVVGDLKHPDEVQRAVAGVQAIIHTAGVGLARGHDTPMTVDYEGTMHLLEAGVAAGVEHFILISVLGAGWIRTSQIFEAKNKAEQEVRASGMRYTILRAGGFMGDYRENWERGGKRGVYLALGRGDRQLPLISPDDLAEIAVRSLTTEQSWNRTFEVTNTERLTPIDVAAIHSRLFNRPIRLQQVPVWPLTLARPLVRPLAPAVADFLGFLQALGAEEFGGAGQEVEATYGLTLEGYADYLERTRPEGIA